MHFKTKTHLLSELREICDAKVLVDFAKFVAADSLNTAKIKVKGTAEEILESLMKAPKSVLEEVFDRMFIEDEEELESDDEEEIEEDDEE